MLNDCFRKARDDEKAASIRLNEMIANYGDVIPRRDFEALEKKHNVRGNLFEFSSKWKSYEVVGGHDN